MVKCPVGQCAIQALLFVNFYVSIFFSTRAAYFLFLVTNCDLFVSSDHLSESAIWSTDPYYLQWSCSPLTGRVTEEWLQYQLYGSDQKWCMLWLSKLWYWYYYCNKVWYRFIKDEPNNLAAWIFELWQLKNAYLFIFRGGQPTKYMAARVQIYANAYFLKL